MKKNKKLAALVVTRETLAVLSDQKLVHVAGGSATGHGNVCSNSAIKCAG